LEVSASHFRATSTVTARALCGTAPNAAPISATNTHPELRPVNIRDPLACRGAVQTPRPALASLSDFCRSSTRRHRQLAWFASGMFDAVKLV
jgi:hypothetical protein